MKTYYVYILHCADDSFYVGVTNDIERRLTEHEEGICETSYTAARLPVELVYREGYKYVKDAIAREKSLKTWSRAKKIALINANHSLVKKLSKKDFSLYRKLAGERCVRPSSRLSLRSNAIPDCRRTEG